MLRQVAELKVGLIEANGRRKEEAAGATSKLRAIVERAEELKVELATAREGAAEKERQLVEHRDEVCACVSSSWYTIYSLLEYAIALCVLLIGTLTSLIGSNKHEMKTLHTPCHFSDDIRLCAVPHTCSRT